MDDESMDDESRCDRPIKEDPIDASSPSGRQFQIQFQENSCLREPGWPIPLSIPTQMLKVFHWNGLYFTRPTELAKEQLQAHYDPFVLARRGVEMTNVR
jgi:hypothetical protein